MRLPNLVLGYHGCTKETADKVLREGEQMRFSHKEHDWLGWGTYFWENSYHRALDWAKEHSEGEEIGVIGAVIDLGRCLNLTDLRATRMLATQHEILQAEAENEKIELPINKGLKRQLDCYVIESLHKDYDQRKDASSVSKSVVAPNGKVYFDSVRGLFFEGKPAFEGAGILEKTHIQICVRNHDCIHGYFRPRLYEK